jgi:hypothetical protein
MLRSHWLVSPAHKLTPFSGGAATPTTANAAAFYGSQTTTTHPFHTLTPPHDAL